MAHPKHRQVRERFGRRCGYCGVAEADAAGELTVDHYRPRSAGGDDADTNLVYACIRCNLYKGDFFPTEDDLAHGRRLLHPVEDNPTLHLREDAGTGELVPLTETGRFHIVVLHLNRPELVTYRIRRRLADLVLLKQSLLEAENRQLRALLAAQESCLEAFRRILGLPPSGSP